MAFSLFRKSKYLFSIDTPNQPETKEEEKELNLEELMDELNDLTGLDGVKKEINNLTSLVKISKIREEKGLKTPTFLSCCLLIYTILTTHGIYRKSRDWQNNCGKITWKHL